MCHLGHQLVAAFNVSNVSAIAPAAHQSQWVKVCRLPPPPPPPCPPNIFFLPPASSPPPPSPHARFYLSQPCRLPSLSQPHTEHLSHTPSTPMTHLAAPRAVSLQRAGRPGEQCTCLAFHCRSSTFHCLFTALRRPFTAFSLPFVDLSLPFSLPFIGQYTLVLVPRVIPSRAAQSGFWNGPGWITDALGPSPAGRGADGGGGGECLIVHAANMDCPPTGCPNHLGLWLIRRWRWWGSLRHLRLAPGWVRPAGRAATRCPIVTAFALCLHTFVANDAVFALCFHWLRGQRRRICLQSGSDGNSARRWVG